ncbi:MAG: glutamate-5-semialdehyde dehydrogenase [Candidatus Pacebacteria bacterium]|nr:glutamate-5-semialdehyde dehydrogenase [Candidatus Paceibacterota bacterium]
MTKQNFLKQLIKTKKAGVELAASSLKTRNAALREIAGQLRQAKGLILKENRKDVRKFKTEDPLRDRLLLTEERIAAMINDIQTVIKLPDHLNVILEEKTIENGLSVRKVSSAFGVVGVIYESRPNVTVDVAVLNLKVGNAVVLKGGDDACFSNRILVELMREALRKAGLAQETILHIDPRDKDLIGFMLKRRDLIDLIIPRGGHGLIKFVRENSEIPVIETGAGVCHTFVDDSADMEMAGNIVYNAKVSRPSVCNSLDTLLVHKKAALSLLKNLDARLREKGVEIYADEKSFAILKARAYPYLKRAKKHDYGREFLSLKMAIRVVEGIDEAIRHIGTYSTKHSEAIVTGNNRNADKFLNSVDAACVYHNASTRFTDGSQFGLGGEIGISTQKLHARGPMSVKELTTYKWIIKGRGQTR